LHIKFLFKSFPVLEVYFLQICVQKFSLLMRPKGVTTIMHLLVVQLYHSQLLTVDRFNHLCMTCQVFMFGSIGFYYSFLGVALCSKKNSVLYVDHVCLICLWLGVSDWPIRQIFMKFGVGITKSCQEGMSLRKSAQWQSYLRV
jgi:hypothetical protein